jgi:hypothetical protein
MLYSTCALPRSGEVRLVVNRPAQIRQIYVELKHALGDEVSAGDLLRLAALIVENYREPEKLDPTFGDGPRQTPFVELELDNAMKDGGWRILEYEGRAGMRFSDELPDNYFSERARIQRLVGRTQWPRIAMD